MIAGAWISCLTMNYVGLAHLPPLSSILKPPIPTRVLPTYSQIVVLTSASCFQHGVVSMGLRRTLLFFFCVLSCVIVAEWKGAWVFGATYEFTEEFGPKFLVPFAWICAAYPSFAVAKTLVVVVRNNVVLIFVASLLTMCVDLACDPVASTGGTHQWIHHDEMKPLWVWQNGVPWSNYVGWFVTSFLFFSLFLSLNNSNNNTHHHVVQFGYLPLWINLSVGVFYVLHPVHTFNVRMAALLGMIAPAATAMLITYRNNASVSSTSSMQCNK